MTHNEIYDLFYRQMAIDYSCTDAEIRSFDNLVKIDAHQDGARAYKPDNHIAKVLSVNGKFVLCIDEKIQKQAEGLIDIMGAWFSLGQNLERLEAIVKPYGYHIIDQHHYYLPLGSAIFSQDELDSAKKQYKIKVYEKDELEQFRGDVRFTSALTFCEKAPDMLAFTAECDGEILGMSGASADSDLMWQIGINVMPKARGKNIGPILTTLIKDEIIKRGKLPYYGTGESHIQSQRVGLKAGFVPTWWEAYAYPTAAFARTDI